MSDWSDYRVTTRQHIVGYGQHTPDTLRGAGTLMTAGNKTRLLNKRPPGQRPLIVMAVSPSMPKPQ